MQCCNVAPGESRFPVPDYSRSNILNRLLSNGDGFEQFEHAFYPRGPAVDGAGEVARPSPSIPAHVFFSRYAPEPTLPPARKAPLSAPRTRAWRGNVAGFMSVSLWLALATSDVKQASDAAAEPAPSSHAQGTHGDRFAFAGPAWRDYDLAALSYVPRARLRPLRAPPSRIADAAGADPMLTRLGVQLAIDVVPAQYGGGRPAADQVVPTSLASSGGVQNLGKPRDGKIERPWTTIMKVQPKSEAVLSAAQRDRDRQALAELVRNTGAGPALGPSARTSVATPGGASGTGEPVSTARPASKVMPPPARLLGGTHSDTQSPRAAKRGRVTSEARHVHRANVERPRAAPTASDQPPQRKARLSDATLVEQLFATPN